MVAARQRRSAEILGAGDGEVLVAPSRACHQRICRRRRQDPRRRSHGRRCALHPCGALAGGIRRGHGSGIYPLAGTPADVRFVNLVDGYDPRLRHRLKKAWAGSRGQRAGKLSIEALILGCTRGAMREARVAVSAWRLFQRAHERQGGRRGVQDKCRRPTAPVMKSGKTKKAPASMPGPLHKIGPAFRLREGYPPRTCRFVCRQ